MAKVATATKTKAADRPAGDTLTAYYGEFLVSPCPLELSFNYCSHKCAYCFANLNRPGRWADVGATSRLLASYHDRDTLEAVLLRDGYPVLCSNRTDPFAASNYRQAVPLLKTMAALGIPLCFQTRGGFGLDELLPEIPPSVWHVSITFADDARRKQVEPGAPTIESRYALIERLTGLGHTVIVAVNPWVPEWQPDPDAVLRRAREAGAMGAWVSQLHLSDAQRGNMTPREVVAIGPLAMDLAQRKAHRPDTELIWSMIERNNKLDFPVFSLGMNDACYLFDLYHGVYPRTFPVVQDFINAMHEAGAGPRHLIAFDDFWGYVGERFPGGQYNISRYLGASVRLSAKGVGRGTFRDLLRKAWNDSSARFSPARLPCFAIASRREPGGRIVLVDEAGDRLYGFKPTGFPESDFEWREAGDPARKAV